MTEESLNSLDDGGLFPRLQQRYGLRANPLEMETPFFPDAMRHHALETLRHLCGFGDMALLLTGAAGSGKTRLLAELVRSESSRLDFHRVPTAALSSTQALARDLKRLAHVGIAADESPRGTVDRFFAWSESRVRKGRRLVLIVDDADKAPPEVLKLLLSAFLAAERASAAVPVFSGADSLVGSLGLDGASIAVHQIHLRPLTKEEIHAYLEPRVHRAGGSVSELLSPSKLEKIQAVSQGSFAGLRRAAPVVWLDMVTGASRPKGKPSANVFRSARWPALALVLLAASWWFVSQQYDQSIARDSAANGEVAAPEPVRKSVTIGPEVPEPAFVAAGPEPEPVPLEPVPGPEPDEPPLTDSEPVTKIPPEPEPEPEPEPAFIAALPDRFTPVGEIRASSGVTVQFVAGYQEQTAVGYINRYSGVPGLRYTRSTRKEQDWFVVYYGKFENAGDARQALENLPDSLRSQPFWIRPLSGF